jgi:hypothetical protein
LIVVNTVFLPDVPEEEMDVDANSSTLKKKAKKPVRRDDSPILKKLITLMKN